MINLILYIPMVYKESIASTNRVIYHVYAGYMSGICFGNLYSPNFWVPVKFLDLDVYQT